MVDYNNINRFIKSVKRQEGIGNKEKIMKNLIDALKRFDSLETVIAELEVCELDECAEILELAEYLNDEADYANE